MKQVAIDLGSGADGRGDDGVADKVSINSTNGHAITATDKNGVVTVSGLASDVTISNFGANDQLFINNHLVTVANGQTVTAENSRSSSMQPKQSPMANRHSHRVNSNNTGGTSTASDGSHAAGLALLGQHMASSFVTTGDGHGATPIADQPSSHQPSLTHPHA